MFHVTFFSFLLITLIFYFIFLAHPLSIALNLFIQTLLFCVLIGSLNSNYWFSYLLFLVFLGGLLIIFAYVATLASNEKFSLSFPHFSALFLSFFLSFLLYFPIIKGELFSLDSFEVIEVSPDIQTVDLYSFSNNSLIYLVIYLLLCLLIVVRVSRLDEGPLRSF